jgi:hypothetical protein
VPRPYEEALASSSDEENELKVEEEDVGPKSFSPYTDDQESEHPKTCYDIEDCECAHQRMPIVWRNESLPGRDDRHSRRLRSRTARGRTKEGSARRVTRAQRREGPKYLDHFYETEIESVIVSGREPHSPDGTIEEGGRGLTGHTIDVHNERLTVELGSAYSELDENGTYWRARKARTKIDSTKGAMRLERVNPETYT